MLASVSVFAALGVIWAASGGLGVAYAVYLLTGSILHTVASANLSRTAFAVLNAPVVIALAAQPLVVGLLHRSWLDALCMTLAVLLVGACAVNVWRGLRAGWRREFALREELSAALERAEAASEAKSTFLATMSHEIRTPLNGVLGLTQSLEADETSPERREKLRVISQSGETLRAILNDVLDMSKIEAGKLTLEAVDFDLRGVLDDVAAAFAPVAAQKGLALTVRAETAQWRRGDPVRVRQILTNLLSNALKFTHVGEVEVALDETEAGVRLQVRDSGIGMAEAELALLFTKFVQADASTTRRYGGTGLGLAITREIVELMDGSVVVHSTPNLGSTFIVDLPLPTTVVGRAGAYGPDMALTLPTAPVPSARLRVLAAEDNPTNRIVLKALLAGADIDPVIVENGLEAFQAWECETWDLILMDVQMPILDGPSAALRIRSAEAQTGRARTPIIAVTANALDHQITEYRLAGMDDHVTKPLAIGDLFAAIGRVLAVDVLETPPRGCTEAA
jgi:signal transduction histidine kinase/CheY-like chemotaxis protein